MGGHNRLTRRIVNAVWKYSGMRAWHQRVSRSGKPTLTEQVRTENQQLRRYLAEIIGQVTALDHVGLTSDRVHVHLAGLRDVVATYREHDPTPRCCNCGTDSVAYTNYLDQEFCWPCANGEE